MTILTDTASRTASRSVAPRRARESADSFILIALALSFVLAMLGLVMTGHARPDVESGEYFPSIIAP